MTKKKITEAKDIHVTGDFIAGDQYNYYYTGDFASLAEYYISPESVFQRVRTDDFIGRDWLTTKVDAFLNDPNRKSGAFLLIGDAGVGKTAFMAHLVKERRYLHLFAEQAPGQAMLQRAMQSLASQLVSRYQIDPYKDRDTLNALSVFPDFLERILRLAASTLTEGEKIVIVCDALDEAGVFPDHFVFGLPKELPDGVFFILTQRPVNVKLPNFEPVIEKLEAQGEGNLQDMQAYLSAVAKRPEVAGQIRSKEYSEEFFVQTLKEKSQGVWMYLHYIIKEIESGARAPLDLANLPTGLVGYYAEYWDAWRTGKRGKGEEAWDELYAPLLTTLAAAQEAIPVDWLIQWADLTAKPREVIRLLTEHWRAFITEKEKDGQKTYTPYHLSFKDFITGRVDTSKLQPAQANLVKDLAAQTVDAHKRIVSTFETECNGEWEKLVEQDYSRLHLTAHLNGAEEYEKLRILLTEGDEKIKWAQTREKKEETYAGYLNDLTYVWDYAEREQNYSLAIRCMLIENSIHSVAANITPELLVELTKAGIWSYARCLAIIREKSDENQIAESLKTLVPYIPTPLLDEVLSIALNIKNIHACVDSISALASLCDERQINEVFNFAINIQSEIPRGRALTAISPYLQNSQLIKMISIANQTPENKTRAEMLGAIAHRINGNQRKKIIQEVFQIINGIDGIYLRLITLITILQYTKGDLKKRFLEETIKFFEKIENEYLYLINIENLLPHTTGQLKRQVLEKTLRALKLMPKDFTRIKTASRVAPYLNKNAREKIIKEAFTIVSKMKVDVRIAEFLESLAPYLNGKFQKQAFFIAANINSDFQRAKALSALAPYMTEDQKNQLLVFAEQTKDKLSRAEIFTSSASYLDGEEKISVLKRALWDSSEIRDEDNVCYFLKVIISQINDLRTIRQIFFHVCCMENDFVRSNTLAGITSKLSDDLKIDAISVTRKNKTDHARERVLAALAPQLDGTAFTEACLTAYEIKDPSHRASALAALISYSRNEKRLDLWEEFIASARQMTDQHFVFKSLSSIGPYLTKNNLSQLIILVQGFSDDWCKSKAIEALAPFLDKKLVMKALETLFEIKDELAKANAAKSLAPYLNQKQILSVIATIRKFPTPVIRASILALFSQYLPKNKALLLIRESIDSLNELRMDSEYFFKLREILGVIPGKIKTQILAETLRISDEDTKAIAISVLAAQFNKTQLNQALAFVNNLEYSDRRAQVTLALLPYLDSPTGKRLARETIAYTRRIDSNVNRMRLRSKISKFLSADLREKIFQEELLSNFYHPNRDLLEEWKEYNYSGIQKVLLPLFKMRARQDRKDGLAILENLIPALVYFSDNQISDDVLQSVLDVTRWWP